MKGKKCVWQWPAVQAIGKPPQDIKQWMVSILLLTVWAMVGLAQISVYDSGAVATYRRQNELKIGQILIENDLDTKAIMTVRLFHPDAPAGPFATWKFTTGDRSFLETNGSRITIGSDWGIQVLPQSQMYFVGQVSRFTTYHQIKLSTLTGESGSRSYQSSWMAANDYQTEFDRQVRGRMYPTKVEGRFVNGQHQFRALFEPFPSGNFAFDARHGISEVLYENLNRKLKGEGYTLLWQQRFTDSAGRVLCQAVWIKT